MSIPQHVGERCIDQAVAGERGHAAKGLRDDAHAKVTLSAGGPRVAGVPVTLILDDELLRRERLMEPCAAAVVSRVSRLMAARHPCAILALPCSQIT